MVVINVKLHFRWVQERHKINSLDCTFPQLKRSNNQDFVPKGFDTNYELHEAIFKFQANKFCSSKIFASLFQPDFVFFGLIIPIFSVKTPK